MAFNGDSFSIGREHAVQKGPIANPGFRLPVEIFLKFRTPVIGGRQRETRQVRVGLDERWTPGEAKLVFGKHGILTQTVGLGPRDILPHDTVGSAELDTADERVPIKPGLQLGFDLPGELILVTNNGLPVAVAVAAE